MDKLKKKQTMFSVLRAIAYFAGFPLMLLIVLLGSTQFRHSAPFLDTWYMGILICAIPWFLTAVLQILFGYFVKNQNIKTIVVVAVTVAVMVGSAGIIDIYGNSVVKKAQETYSTGKYADAAVEVKGYNNQVNWYITMTKEGSLTDKFMSQYNRFVTVYNINMPGGKGSSRSSKNTDGSPVKHDTEKGLGLEGATISPNGLLSDGWVFSVDNAITILTTYNELLNKAAAAGIDLEAEYDNVIATVEAGDEYTAYKDTAEYKAAYGEDGSAYHHMLNEERLNEMLPVIAKYLGLIIKDVANLGAEATEAFFNGILDVNGIANIRTVDDLVAYANANIPSVAALVDTFVGDPALNPLRDDSTVSGYMELDKATVLDLAAEFTYYVSPQARPIFDFIAETTKDNGSGERVLACNIEDGEGNVIITAAEMQRFAYARYYGKTHGANIGSILIPTKSVDAEGKETYSNIGQVTMNDSGYPASFGFTLPELYTLESYLSYAPQLYPLLAARRYLYVFAGICALCMMLFYQFLRREDEIRDEMIIQGGAM